MPQIFDIVQNNGIQWTNDVRANMGAAGINATLKTANSLRIEVREEGTKIKMTAFGASYFTIPTQTGRRPTPDKKPSRDMIANIAEWVGARGLPESAVWAIAVGIQKKGTALWRDGGRTDIIEPATDDLVNNVAQELLDAKADDLILKIREMKW